MLAICSSVRTYFPDLEVMAMALLFFPYVTQYFRMKNAGQAQDIEEGPLSGQKMCC